MDYLKGLLALAVVGGLTIFYQTYIKAWAKSLVTIQQLDRVTRTVEEIKDAFTHRQNVNSFRYQKEFEILVELCGYVTTYSESHYMLLEYIYGTENAQFEYKSSSAYKESLCAYNNLKHAADTYSPFFPEDIFLLITSLDSMMKKSVFRFANIFKGRNIESDAAWAEYEKDALLITPQIKLIMAAIRERAESWELNILSKQC